MYSMYAPPKQTTISKQLQQICEDFKKFDRQWWSRLQDASVQQIEDAYEELQELETRLKEKPDTKQDTEQVTELKSDIHRLKQRFLAEQEQRRRSGYLKLTMMQIPKPVQEPAPSQPNRVEDTKSNSKCLIFSSLTLLLIGSAGISAGATPAGITIIAAAAGLLLIGCSMKNTQPQTNETQPQEPERSPPLFRDSLTD